MRARRSFYRRLANVLAALDVSSPGHTPSVRSSVSDRSRSIFAASLHRRTPRLSLSVPGTDSSGKRYLQRHFVLVRSPRRRRADTTGSPDCGSIPPRAAALPPAGFYAVAPHPATAAAEKVRQEISKSLVSENATGSFARQSLPSAPCLSVPAPQAAQLPSVRQGQRPPPALQKILGRISRIRLPSTSPANTPRNESATPAVPDRSY